MMLEPIGSCQTPGCMEPIPRNGVNGEMRGWDITDNLLHMLPGIYAGL